MSDEIKKRRCLECENELGHWKKQKKKTGKKKKRQRVSALASSPNTSESLEARTHTRTHPQTGSTHISLKQQWKQQGQWRNVGRGRNRVHTLVAHHQVCQTLKENKSTVSRESRDHGKAVRCEHAGIFKTEFQMPVVTSEVCGLGEGQEEEEEEEGTQTRGRPDEHQVDRSRSQCVISHLRVIVQKCKRRRSHFQRAGSAPPPSRPTNSCTVLTPWSSAPHHHLRHHHQINTKRTNPVALILLPPSGLCVSPHQPAQQLYTAKLSRIQYRSPENSGMLAFCLLPSAKLHFAATAFGAIFRETIFLLKIPISKLTLIMDY